MALKLRICLSYAVEALQKARGTIIEILPANTWTKQASHPVRGQTKQKFMRLGWDAAPSPIRDA